MKHSLPGDILFLGWSVNPDEECAYEPGRGFTEEDVDRILRLLRRNKVPLAFLSREQMEVFPDFFNSAQFEAAYLEEKAVLENLRREWCELREEFLKAGIESMLIKAVDSFPYKSSNLDVLIRNEKRERAGSILRGLGYIQLHNVQEPYKTLFRKFNGGKSVSVIHLHDKVAWINPFHQEAILWDRYRRSGVDPAVDVPSPEDCILILTAHWFYEDKELKLSDLRNVSWCLKKGAIDWDYMETIANRMGWLEGLYFGLLVQSFIETKLYGVSSIQESRIERMKSALPGWLRFYFLEKVCRRPVSLPFMLPKVFGKSLHFKKTIQDTTTKTSTKAREFFHVAYASLFVVLFEKFKINIRSQPSMLISISGIDGSGKTTYAEALSDILEFCELKYRYVWCRVGSSSFLKPFSWIAKNLLKVRKNNSNNSDVEETEDSTREKRDLFGKSRIMRISGMILLLVEMIWQYTFRVRIPLIFKKIVVCDRYYFDTLADVKTRYSSDLESFEGKCFKNILAIFSPTPDIAYLIDVPVAEAIKRREFSSRELNQIESQKMFYQDMESKYGLCRIDASSHIPIVDGKNKIICDALTKYYNKW